MEFRFLLNPTIGGITSPGRGRNGHTPRMRRHRVQRYVILILFSIPDLGSEDYGFYSGLPPLDPSSAGVKRFFSLFFLFFSIARPSLSHSSLPSRTHLSLLCPLCLPPRTQISLPSLGLGPPALHGSASDGLEHQSNTFCAWTTHAWLSLGQQQEDLSSGVAAASMHQLGIGSDWAAAQGRRGRRRWSGQQRA